LHALSFFGMVATPLAHPLAIGVSALPTAHLFWEDLQPGTADCGLGQGGLRPRSGEPGLWRTRSC
jgi:hypothetical protein